MNYRIQEDHMPRRQISRFNEIRREGLQINQEYTSCTIKKEQTNNWTFYCNDCDKIFTGVKSQEEHLKSKKHLEKMSAKIIPFLLPKEENMQIQTEQRNLFTLNGELDHKLVDHKIC